MDPNRLAAAAGYYWSALHPEDAVQNVFKIFVPTLYDSSLAPAGCQILIVQKLTRAPWHEITDWRAHREQTQLDILRRLRRVLPDIDSHIVGNLETSAWTSYYFTGNWQGAMLGWEMSPKQLGPGRLSNTTPIQNLYLTGHWTRPGGGVTPVIVSAQRAAESILGGRRKHQNSPGISLSEAPSRHKQQKTRQAGRDEALFHSSAHVCRRSGGAAISGV